MPRDRVRKKATKYVPPPVVMFSRLTTTSEGFGDPGWSVDRAGNREPSFVNSLSLRRFRVTVELIDEPVEVLRDRFITLWRSKERNYHHWDVAKRATAELGLDWEVIGPQEAADHPKEKRGL